MYRGSERDVPSWEYQCGMRTWAGLVPGSAEQPQLILYHHRVATCVTCSPHARPFHSRTSPGREL